MTDISAPIALLHPLPLVETMSSSIAQTMLGVADATSTNSEWLLSEKITMFLWVLVLVGLVTKALSDLNTWLCDRCGRTVDRPSVSRARRWFTWVWLFGFLAIAVSFSTPTVRPWMTWSAYLAGMVLSVCSAFLFAFRGGTDALSSSRRRGYTRPQLEAIGHAVLNGENAFEAVDRYVPVRRIYKLRPDQVDWRTPYKLDIEGVPFKVDHPVSETAPWTLRLQRTRQTGWRRLFVRRAANKPARLRSILDREHALGASD